MQSMQDLPFLNPFCSSNSKTSAITVNLFAMSFEYIYIYICMHVCVCVYIYIYFNLEGHHFSVTIRVPAYNSK